MPPIAPNEDFAKRYGIEAVPESVRRLGELVSRPDATVEEITKLICQDKELSERLLRAANPKAESEADYDFTTVEEALNRTGVGSALLLAMHDPLLRAVHKTFLTMLGVGLKPLMTPVLPIEGEHVLCEIVFTGRATGAAALRLTPQTALRIAAQVLGVSPADLGDTDAIDDVIGELSNIVVGNFKSNLCDAGLKCKLSPPAITRTSNFKLRSNANNQAQRIAFHAPDLDLFVDLNVNPWND